MWTSTMQVVAPAVLLATAGVVSFGWQGKAAAAGQGREAAGAREADPRDIAGAVRIPLRQAIERAVTARKGAAVEAELEGRIAGGKTAAAFEVKIVTAANDMHELRVDGQSGEVVSDERLTGREDLDELAGFRRALRKCELSLAALVGKAEEILKGTAVAASLEVEDGSPACEVLFVHTRYLIEATVEGRAGQLVELELEDGQGGEEHEEDEGDDERGRRQHEGRKQEEHH